MGKTTLIKEIIATMVSHNPHLNVYHLDTKKQGDFTSSEGTVISSDIAPDAFTTTGNRMVWQPMDDDFKEYDNFFKRILSAHLSCIVNIDECANMKMRDGKVPRQLSLLSLQGKAFGMSVIGGTQEVAESPRQMRSQSDWIICFNVVNKYDKNEMIEALHLIDDKGKKPAYLGLKPHQFWAYNNVTQSPPKLYKSYHDFLHLIT